MPTSPADESPETLEDLVAQLKRANRALDKARDKEAAIKRIRDSLVERIHELTKPSGQ